MCSQHSNMQMQSRKWLLHIIECCKLLSLVRDESNIAVHIWSHAILVWYIFRAQNTKGLRVIRPKILQNSPFEFFCQWQNIHKGGYSWYNLSKTSPVTEKVFLALYIFRDFQVIFPRGPWRITDSWKVTDWGQIHTLVLSLYISELTNSYHKCSLIKRSEKMEQRSRNIWSSNSTVLINASLMSVLSDFIIPGLDKNAMSTYSWHLHFHAN